MVDSGKVSKVSTKRVSRRELLKGAGLAGLGLALSAAAPRSKPKLTLAVRGFFGDKTNDLFKQQCETWGKNNNVDVVVDIVSMNDIPAKLATAAEAGAGPDIIHLLGNTPYLYAEKLADMSNICRALDSQFGGFTDASKESVLVGGAWRALPHIVYSDAMVYRADVLDQLGVKVPTTFEEALEVGKKLKATKKYTMGWPLGHSAGDGNQLIYTLLWSYGGREMKKDGKTLALDSPGTVKALKMVKALYDVEDPGVISWDDSSNNRAFLAGQLALTYNSASIWMAAKKDNPDLAKNMRHAIHLKGTEGPYNLAETWSLGLFKYSKVQDEAKALLKYLMSKPQYPAWIEAAGGDVCPALKGYASEPMWNDPMLKPYVEATGSMHMTGWPGPPTRAVAEAYNNFILLDMAAMVVKGSTPKDAIKWAVDQYKGLVSR